ncbi:hypothetical protein H0A36_21215 [Endozoicomonas sp. SM1973]|uniref:Uncharacterized protein n=1 Tax=Spartinivicinus marinus TaxID=2994442 RepID=A0A853IDB3_9GAMM|nr:hypothetical protein [Spartinivicinus marinus]MCX4027734.1 hypothetical protein [Spartinivicinus marinus]NYZ68538.1 hypothetical protein [Spartinivicinus marinus]
MNVIDNNARQVLFVVAILFNTQAMSSSVAINTDSKITISSNAYLLNSYKRIEVNKVYRLIVPYHMSVVSFMGKQIELNVVMSKEKDNYELKCTSYAVGNNKSVCVVTIADKGLYYAKFKSHNQHDRFINIQSRYVNTDVNKKYGYCYEEVIKGDANIADLKSKFSRYNWLQTIMSVYDRRWQSGVKLVKAQANDPYFSQFVNKTNFNKMAESLMVAIHEETHMYDLDPSRTDWEQQLTAYVNQHWQPKVPIHGGFPRREIIPLLESNVTKPWDDLYLRDRTQGSYLMQGVLSELNAGLTGLVGVAVVGEYIDGYGASNAMDSAAAYMYHLQLYLRQAKKMHSSYYNKIKSEELFRDFILIQWLRLHYYIQLAKGFSILGTDYQEILELLYRPNNIKVIEDITGHSLQLDGDKSCLSSDDPFEPPF